MTALSHTGQTLALCLLLGSLVFGTGSLQAESVVKMAARAQKAPLSTDKGTVRLYRVNTETMAPIANTKTSQQQQNTAPCNTQEADAEASAEDSLSMQDVNRYVYRSSHCSRRKLIVRNAAGMTRMPQGNDEDGGEGDEEGDN